MFPMHNHENERLLYLFHGLLVSINDDRLNLESNIFLGKMTTPFSQSSGNA